MNNFRNAKPQPQIVMDLMSGIVREGGATVNPWTNGEVPETGYMVGGICTRKIPKVAFRSWEVEAWVRDTQPVALAESLYMGAWLGKEDGTEYVYLDLSHNEPSLTVATYAAIALGELAIWDCENEREIPVV